MTESWSEHLAGLDLPVAVPPTGPVVVLSAHPDDEVLAVGAWLSARRASDLVFVTATDGESSHPGSPTTTPEHLRRVRPLELVAALEALGIARPVVHRLRLPDSGLADVRETMLGLLRPHVDRAGLVLAPFRHDGHADHDVLGSVAAELCGSHTKLWEMPIWTWAWTDPGRHDWSGAVPHRLASTAADRDAKRRAIREFATQVEPLSDHSADAAVVSGLLLEHALDAPEVVLA